MSLKYSAQNSAYTMWTYEYVATAYRVCSGDVDEEEN